MSFPLLSVLLVITTMSVMAYGRGHYTIEIRRGEQGWDASVTCIFPKAAAEHNIRIIVGYMEQILNLDGRHISEDVSDRPPDSENYVFSSLKLFVNQIGTYVKMRMWKHYYQHNRDGILQFTCRKVNLQSVCDSSDDVLNFTLGGKSIKWYNIGYPTLTLAQQLH